MNKSKIKIGKIWIIFFSIFLIFIFLYSEADARKLERDYNNIINSPETGGCSGLNHLSDDNNLVGACCNGVMSFERYSKQVKYLRRYSNIKEIPKDPWNVPVAQARKLIEYNDLELNEDEQRIYDKAFEIFEEGPCCCKCWRWYTFNGLAKYLIKNYNFDSEQIAKLWAAEDVCGDEDPLRN